MSRHREERVCTVLRGWNDEDGDEEIHTVSKVPRSCWREPMCDKAPYLTVEQIYPDTPPFPLNLEVNQSCVDRKHPQSLHTGALFALLVWTRHASTAHTFVSSTSQGRQTWDRAPQGKDWKLFCTTRAAQSILNNGKRDQLYAHNHPWYWCLKCVL